MKHSLRTRLTLSFLLVIVATAGLVVLLANRITANRLTYMVSHAGRLKAQRLAPLFANYYVQVGSWDGVEALMADLFTVQWSHGMRGFGQQGGRMPMMGMMGTTEAEDERLFLVDGAGQIVAISVGQNDDVRLSPDSLNQGAPILVAGQPVGRLIVASSLGGLTANQTSFLRQVNWLMVLAALVAGLAVLIVGSFQARRIVAPVRELAQAARRVADGDLSQRVRVTSEDELGEMGEAFNRMAAELERQHELRHRAMTDIAHELRTPLSVLQIDIESIEDGLTDPTPEVIAGLREEVVLLKRLVEDLRMLSLAEAGELQLELEPVDVAALVRSAVERGRAAAREKGVTLSADVSGPLPPVLGDGHRLIQVLLNLLSNALRHTPPGGQVTVILRSAGQGVHVVVRDTGEGIPADALPHLFERFYRTDQARSRDAGGSGLGLTIARSLVEAHGGRIWAESEPGAGSTFTIALPTVEYGEEKGY
ncbi:MAG TPA: HAMP domain-containing protein [Chloroflexi bacterium]|nr:HAMP domain-containing protein [Chloroflexota bacterium]